MVFQVSQGNDCDDDDDTIYPSAPEICDGQVNTCGGSLPANEIDDDGDDFVECVFHSEGWDRVSMSQLEMTVMTMMIRFIRLHLRSAMVK